MSTLYTVGLQECCVTTLYISFYCLFVYLLSRLIAIFCCCERLSLRRRTSHGEWPPLGEWPRVQGRTTRREQSERHTQQPSSVGRRNRGRQWCPHNQRYRARKQCAARTWLWCSMLQRVAQHLPWLLMSKCIFTIIQLAKQVLDWTLWNTLSRGAVWCGTVWCGAVLCSTQKTSELSAFMLAVFTLVIYSWP